MFLFTSVSCGYTFRVVLSESNLSFVQYLSNPVPGSTVLRPIRREFQLRLRAHFTVHSALHPQASHHGSEYCDFCWDDFVRARTL